MTLSKFPVLHRYISTLMIMRGLSERSYIELLEATGEYELIGRCECGQIDCGTVYLQRDETMPEDVVDVFSLGDGTTSLNFRTDGSIELESLQNSGYPYIKEINAFFEENSFLNTDAETAQMKVTDFFESNQVNDMSFFVVD